MTVSGGSNLFFTCESPIFRWPLPTLKMFKLDKSYINLCLVAILRPLRAPLKEIIDIWENLPVMN